VELDARVTQVMTEDNLTISDLLETNPSSDSETNDSHLEQQKDTKLKQMCDYLESGVLPESDKEAKKIVAQSMHFTLIDHVLYFIEHGNQDFKRAAVPSHLQEKILQENHGGVMAGHFSGSRLYKMLRRKWWWATLYKDTINFCKNCAECAIVSGTGKHQRPPLHPIPVSRPFQIMGVDIMELPITKSGNRYVIVFQDYLTKWPLVFAAPDQKAVRIARLLAEEVVPLFGCPEVLLSDRGTNLLANVMQDTCQLMGITKLNTTAYHPQCDGMVERMNRTLKAMLRKHVAKFGSQWDAYLPGVLWAYRNTPHESTQEKPSFLLFGVNCRSPTEAALLPPERLDCTDVADYREQLMMSLSSARQLAVSSIQAAQGHYKAQYDKKSKPANYQLGDWVLIRFPQEEQGKQRKLSRPWHGPYRITQRNDPDVTAVKVYFPDETPLQVHQTQVCPAPSQLPTSFYWYGGAHKSAGKVPKWLNRLLSHDCDVVTEETADASEPGQDELEDVQQLIEKEQQGDKDELHSKENWEEMNHQNEGNFQAESTNMTSHPYSLRQRSKINAPKRLIEDRDNPQ